MILLHRACTWIVGRDTGLASITLWAVMMGVEPACPSIPYDLADFGRCYRLLAIIPEWRPRLAEVAERYPDWRPIIENWAKWEERYLVPVARQDISRTFTMRFTSP